MSIFWISWSFNSRLNWIFGLWELLFVLYTKQILDKPRKQQVDYLKLLLSSSSGRNSSKIRQCVPCVFDITSFLGSYSNPAGMWSAFSFHYLTGDFWGDGRLEQCLWSLWSFQCWILVCVGGQWLRGREMVAGDKKKADISGISMTGPRRSILMKLSRLWVSSEVSSFSVCGL